MTLRHAIVPAYLALCLLLGGASAAGYVANLILQLLALPLIGWSLWVARHESPTGSARTLLLLLGGLIALCLLQLVPLPPALWTALPGREPVARGFELLQIPLPWLPLTLAPDRTIASLLWLLPAFAALLSMLLLGAFRARWLAWVLLAVTGAAVALGALQLVGGEGGAYLYKITNYGVAVGFFANANHAATLLLVCIPFLAALQLHAKRGVRSRRNASAVTVLTVAALAVIIVGLATNLSLAGIGLCLPVALASFFGITHGDRPGRPVIAVSAGLLSVIAVAVIILGPFGNNLIGEQKENASSSRQVSFARTLHAAGEYFPVGSGVGSFLSVYKTQEPPAEATRTYMNHAHSDWIEIALETGVPGLLLSLVFLGWWAKRVRTVWNADEVDLWGRAAAIASAAIMVHSIVDYPLRTAALSTVFAICLALMTGARPAVARRRQAPTTSRHLSI